MTAVPTDLDVRLVERQPEGPDEAIKRLAAMAQQLGGDGNELLGRVEPGLRERPRHRPIEDDLLGPLLPQRRQVATQPGLYLPRACPLSCFSLNPHPSLPLDL